MVDITSAITSASQLTANGSRTGITTDTVADNFDTFLSLLTTQLKNQDPLSPMDTDQFTSQLVQFTEVEQLIASNKNLEALVQLSTANASVGLVSYVGKDAVIKGNETSIDNGKASWQLSVPENADSVTYIVKDASGNEVYSETGSLSAGDASFTWDGSTSSGGTVTSGSYSLQVAASSGSNDSIGVGIAIRGVVDGVDMTGDSPQLLINGTKYDIDDVQEVHQVG